MARIKAGEGPCPVCGEKVVWRLADSGSLSCFCQDCDFQGYAKEGTQAKKALLSRHGLKAEQAAPEVKPDGQAPKPEKSAFGGFGL